MRLLDFETISNIWETNPGFLDKSKIGSKCWLLNWFIYFDQQFFLMTRIIRETQIPTHQGKRFPGISSTIQRSVVNAACTTRQANTREVLGWAAIDRKAISVGRVGRPRWRLERISNIQIISLRFYQRLSIIRTLLIGILVDSKRSVWAETHAALVCCKERKKSLRGLSTPLSVMSVQGL